MDILLKFGIYILLLIPGFILVQTKDYHLLREKKPQFEKTFEIILWSAIIWFIAFASPIWFPFNSCRELLINLLGNKIKQDVDFSILNHTIIQEGRSSSILYLTVCVWSFIIANLWGIIRKFKCVDAFIKLLTGRDWYPSVAYRFFNENLNKAVEVQVEDIKYIGVLHSAPDNKEDKYIIITEPYIIYKKENTFIKENLPLIDHVIVKIDEIIEMKSFKKSILVDKEDKNG